MATKPNTWWKRQRAKLATAIAFVTPPIYTKPEPAIQRPVNSNSTDRKGWQRHPLGRQVIKEKGKR